MTFTEVNRLDAIAFLVNRDERGSVIAVELVVPRKTLRRLPRLQAPFRSLCAGTLWHAIIVANGLAVEFALRRVLSRNMNLSFWTVCLLDRVFGFPYSCKTDYGHAAFLPHNGSRRSSRMQVLAIAINNSFTVITLCVDDRFLVLNPREKD